MSPAEAQVLISMAAAIDNRKPDPDAARAWAALLDGLGFEDCRTAVLQHLQTSTEWLTPALVRTAVLRVRRERRIEHRRLQGPLLPPPGLTNAEERAWERDALKRISNGDVIDSEAPYGELVAGSVRELLAAATPTTTTEETP